MHTPRKLLHLLLFATFLVACEVPAAFGGAAPATGTPSTPNDTPSPAVTATPTPVPGTLFVDPGVDLGPISPLVYGTNYGPWVALPFQMLPDAQALAPSIIRFPGGAWGDQNGLRGYQIDQFIGFCKLLKAEASISVRLLGGTPEQAAALVKYTNIQKSYNVRYWSIGNEPTLYEAAGTDGYDTARYNTEWRAIAEAMQAVDPDILLIGPELHQFTANASANPKDSAGKDWMAEFLKANGDLVDVISIHRYPFPAAMDEPVPSLDELRQSTREWSQTIPYLRGVIQELSGRDIPIAVTEINSSWTNSIGRETTPDSFYNALWWADVLGRLIRERVTIVNHWLLTSPEGQSGWGLIGRGVLRPSYYVYMMYQKFGTQLVYASSPDPDLTIYAAKRPDGALTFIVINLSDETKQLPLTVEGLAAAQAETWLFDATHNAENIGTTALAGSELSLPAQSMSLFILADE